MFMLNIVIKVAINDDYWTFNFPTSTATTVTRHKKIRGGMKECILFVDE